MFLLNFLKLLSLLIKSYQCVYKIIIWSRGPLSMSLRFRNFKKSILIFLMPIKTQHVIVLYKPQQKIIMYNAFKFFNKKRLS